MKIQEEIDELKRQWEKDPCWDIEDTEGFAFNEGSPTDNGFMFCPYCGRKMKENRQTTQEEDV